MKLEDTRIHGERSGMHEHTPASCDTCGIYFLRGKDALRAYKGEAGARVKYYCSNDCFSNRHASVMYRGPIPWMPPVHLQGWIAASRKLDRARDEQKDEDE